MFLKLLVKLKKLMICTLKFLLIHEYVIFSSLDWSEECEEKQESPLFS